MNPFDGIPTVGGWSAVALVVVTVLAAIYAAFRRAKDNTKTELKEKTDALNSAIGEGDPDFVGAAGRRMRDQK